MAQTAQPESFTVAKVVIVKPLSMRDRIIGQQIFPSDGPSTFFGDPNLIACYKSGPFRVIECYEDKTAQMTLTDNCIVIFPVPIHSSCFSVDASVQSLIFRAYLATSFVNSASFIAVPFYEGEGNCGGMFKKVEHELLKALAVDFSPGESDSEASARWASLRNALKQNLKFVQTYVEVTPAIQLRFSEAIDNIKHELLALGKTGFFSRNFNAILSVGSISELAMSHLPLGTNINWTYFVNLLSETGNCWLESSVTSSSNLEKLGAIRANNLISPIGTFCQLLEILASSTDSSASSLELSFLAAETMLTNKHRPGAAIRLVSNADLPRFLEYLDSKGFGLIPDASRKPPVQQAPPSIGWEGNLALKKRHETADLNDAAEPVALVMPQSEPIKPMKSRRGCVLQ